MQVQNTHTLARIHAEQRNVVSGAQKTKTYDAKERKSPTWEIIIYTQETIIHIQETIFYV